MPFCQVVDPWKIVVEIWKSSEALAEQLHTLLEHIWEKEDVFQQLKDANIFIKEAQGDSGELWRALDRTMGTAAIRAEYVHSAEDFAGFFASKVAKIRQETANAPYSILAATSSAVLPQFTNVSIVHIIELINESPFKHSDTDPLPTWLLKECSLVLAPFLAALFNLSLTQSLFPTKMKMATVVPLLKKDNLDVTELKNYRPVSNLSFISAAGARRV